MSSPDSIAIGNAGGLGEKLSAAGDSKGRPSAEASKRAGIRDAARQFESLFMEQLIRQMRDAQLSEGFFGNGAGSSIYEGMFSTAMADHLTADSPLGIARLLEERWTGEAAPDGEPQRVLREVAAERASRTYRNAGLPAGASAGGSAVASAPAAAARTPGVSREFGWGQDPLDGETRFHEGLDLPAVEGTPVLAVAPGRVLSTETTPGYGLSVVIRHAGGWTTRYAHLSAAEARPGQAVGRGQVLGQVGSTGRSTGPHLHFEAHLEGRPVDPARAAPGELRPQVLGPTADEIHERRR